MSSKSDIHGTKSKATASTVDPEIAEAAAYLEAYGQDGLTVSQIFRLHSLSGCARPAWGMTLNIVKCWRCGFSAKASGAR